MTFKLHQRPVCFMYSMCCNYPNMRSFSLPFSRYHVYKLNFHNLTPNDLWPPQTIHFLHSTYVMCLQHQMRYCQASPSWDTIFTRFQQVGLKWPLTSRKNMLLLLMKSTHTCQIWDRSNLPFFIKIPCLQAGHHISLHTRHHDGVCVGYT